MTAAVVVTTQSQPVPHRDPERRGLPMAQWPPADRAAWQAAQVAGGPLDDPGPAAGWSGATRKKVAGSYGRYLGWVQRRHGLEPCASAETLLNQDWVGEYLADATQAVASSTVLNRVGDLRLFANAVLPGAGWGWLGRMEVAVRQRARPLRDQRARLRPVRELVELARS